MSFAVLTPYDRGKARQEGGRLWKRLLPVGEIAYKGRTLKFTKDYLSGLVDAFKQRAYDQVPFQLADAANTHTNDPERTRGQITDMKLRDDGLWVGMDPTPEGRAVLTSNPGLGVSARIVEGYDRSDGKFFPRAIQHVLGTLDPRIPGLGGWQAVEAANDVQLTVDLSSQTYTREEPAMPDLDTQQQEKLAKLLNLDPDRLAQLVAGMEPGTEPTPGDLGEDDDPELQALLDRIDNATDEELEQIAAEMGAGDPEPEPALSNTDRMAVELAQATGDANTQQLALIQERLDDERWDNERGKLVRDGTPPHIADLAQPLLHGAGHVVDLANGESVDAGQIVRKILHEYQQLGEQLGLGVELGTPLDGGDDGETEAVKERSDIVAAFKRDYLV